MVGGIKAVAVDAVFVIAKGDGAVIIQSSQYADAVISFVVAGVSILVIREGAQL